MGLFWGSGMNNSASPCAGRWRKFRRTKLHSGDLSDTFSNEAAAGSILPQTGGATCSFPRVFLRRRARFAAGRRISACVSGCVSLALAAAPGLKMLSKSGVSPQRFRSRWAAPSHHLDLGV